MKRYKFIACNVLHREAYFCAGRSPNFVDVVFMPQGLHNTPEVMVEELKKNVDEIKDSEGNPYDAILLGYGLCSNGIAGLSAKIPLVVPRAHDCITLLLGSKEKYREYFDSHKGVYWYSPGWIDTNTQPSKDRYEMHLAKYVEKYGEDNAQYLMEMEQGWMKEYTRATYIDWGIADSENYKQYTKDCATYLDWDFDELSGSASLMQRLVDGDWDDRDFLVVEPGKKIEPDAGSENIIKSE